MALLSVNFCLLRSIPLPLQQQMTQVLESDVLVRSVYDVKAIDMGGLNVRYKAEIDFDGRQLTRSYLDKQDLDTMLEVQDSFFIQCEVVRHGFPDSDPSSCLVQC